MCLCCREFMLRNVRNCAKQGSGDNNSNVNFIHSQAAMPKYHVKLQSGRELILDHPGNEYDIAYEAYEEACLHDDYLVDVELLPDV